MNGTALWVAMLCSSERTRSFEGICHLHLQGRTVKPNKEPEETHGKLPPASVGFLLGLLFRNVGLSSNYTASQPIRPVPYKREDEIKKKDRKILVFTSLTSFSPLGGRDVSEGYASSIFRLKVYKVWRLLLHDIPTGPVSPTPSPIICLYNLTNSSLTHFNFKVF
jgi:hypothetical protein